VGLLSQTIPASGGARPPAAGASTTAGTRERRPDHFRRWIGPRWTRDRRRADHAWSFLFHRVPNPGRDILNSSGTRVEDRGRERHGVVDLGDRSFNPPRHRHRGGDVQWSERPHPNRDRLRVRNVSASRHRLRVGGK